MDRPTRLHPQLTFDVKPHPAIDHMSDPILAGELKISGALHCPRDIQTGDELTVTVATADGEVIAQAVLEAGAPGFKVLTEKDELIGMARITTGKVKT